VAGEVLRFEPLEVVRRYQNCSETPRRTYSGARVVVKHWHQTSLWYIGWAESRDGDPQYLSVWWMLREDDYGLA